MASLSNDKGGLRRIVVKCGDGVRRPLRLGRIPDKHAATIFAHVSRLEACQFDGSAPSPQTSAWLSEVSDTLRSRLVALGLTAPKIDARVMTLQDLVDAYKARPRWAKLKPNSVRNQTQWLRYLLAHFGPECPVPSIVEADGEDYHGTLRLPKSEGGKGKGLSRSSAESACSMAHRVFRYAVKARIIDRNPFDDTPRGKGPRGNNVNVPAADALAVMAELPDTQWKLLFALSRWGGLRCPSEPRLLTWDDIDWDRQRFLVHAPKTEHREGHGTRWVPIFPELAELFDQRWQEAEPGDKLVLPFMATRTAGTFSRRVARAVVFAGVKPWPRLFHSMRSTRQTELADRFPIHTVCAWIGNSEAVATKHYLQTTEAHFAEAAHNAAQTTPAKARQGKTRRSVPMRKPLDSRTVAVAGVGGL